MTKKESNLNKYHFYNLPKALKKSDYQEVCDLTVNDFKNNPNVKSIYLDGGEWVPGISDLDILVVYNNRIVECKKNNFHHSLSKKAKFIFLHDNAIFDEEYFENLQYLISDIKNLRLQWGKDILIRSSKDELSSNDYRLLNSILIFKFLINKLLFFPRYLTVKKIDVRHLLGELHSLIYTLEMMEIVSGEKINSDFPMRIRQLRNNWFQNKQEDNLKEFVLLIDEGIDLILEIVIGLDKFVKNQSLPMDENLVFQNRKYYITFKRIWSKEMFLQNLKEGYIAIKKYFWDKRIVENFKMRLPLSLSYFMLAYANYDGSLSDWIKKGLLNYRQLLELNVSKGIERHIIQANRFVLANIENNGIYKIPFSYGLLSGKRTIKSKIGEKLILVLRCIKNKRYENFIN